jgi:hypothetical protein
MPIFCCQYAHSTGKLPISAKSQFIHQQAFPISTEDNPYSGTAVDLQAALARPDYSSNASLNNDHNQLMMLLNKQPAHQSRQPILGDYISAQAF